MRKIILFIILIFLQLETLGQAQVPHFSDSLFSTYYHQRVSLFKNLPKTQNDIIFLGNSITDGGEWSELFQDLRIKNRGISGDYTIGVLKRIEEITDRNPDKVFLLIGVNDLKSGLKPDSVVKNILWICSIIKEKCPKTKLYVQSILPVNEVFGKFGSHTNKKEEIIEVNKQLAFRSNSIPYTFIDIFTPFCDSTGRMKGKFTNDGLHLKGEGYLKWKELIQSKVYENIEQITLPEINNLTNKKLALPAIFTDSLVFQQNMDIPVWGTSCGNCEVKIAFNGFTKTTIANKDGAWKMTLPATKSGGPFTLQVSDKNSNISLKDILVGEVWLCSGQSNMEFTLTQSKNGNEEITQAQFPQIRFFSMTANAKARPLAKVAFSDSLLQELNAGNFYNKTTWRTCSPTTAAKFSAVAYYFGKELHQNLNVPIGLICNAVGGTTTQAFIDSITLSSHPQLIQFLGNNQGKTWLETAKDVHPWVIERTNENLGKNIKTKAFLHPFAPTFLFENGIKPIATYAIKGAIWYQGESNATHPEIHDALFMALVNNWRNAWLQGSFPIYTVQLPKISNRSRWSEFRESQRKLSENLENSGMVVTIDSGDSLDVHPKEKELVGKRLSLLALAKTYHQALEYSGPVFEKYEIKKDELQLYFSHAKELRPNEIGKPIKGFYLHGYNKSGSKELIIEATSIKIDGSKLIIPVPSELQLTSIKYAWLPYPICNLANETGLPASPFKIDFVGGF